MAYGFDLSRVSLERFRELIRDGYLIPSMRVLRDGLDENFRAIEAQGVSVVSELEKAIGTPKKAEAFVSQTGIDGAYVTALRRFVSSYKAKPRKLDEFPDISGDQLQAMKNKGITNSKTLFEHLAAGGDLGMTAAQRQRVWSLMEVTQLRYVSPLFSTALVMAGYDSIAAVAQAEPGPFLQALLRVNKEHQVYGGNIGESDVQFLIEDARFFVETQ